MKISKSMKVQGILQLKTHRSTENTKKLVITNLPNVDIVRKNASRYTFVFRSEGTQVVPDALLNAPLFWRVPLMEIKSIELKSSLIELKSSLIELKSSLIQIESSLIQLESSLFQ